MISLSQFSPVKSKLIVGEPLIEPPNRALSLSPGSLSPSSLRSSSLIDRASNRAVEPSSLRSSPNPNSLSQFSPLSLRLSPNPIDRTVNEVSNCTSIQFLIEFYDSIFYSIIFDSNVSGLNHFIGFYDSTISDLNFMIQFPSFLIQLFVQFFLFNYFLIQLLKCFLIRFFVQLFNCKKN